jgi:hypothetical protein
MEASSCPLEQAESAVAAMEQLLRRPAASALDEVTARLEEAIAAVSQLERELRTGWRPPDAAALRSRILAARVRLQGVGALLENMGRLQLGRLQRMERQAGYTSSGRCAIPMSAARLAIQA